MRFAVVQGTRRNVDWNFWGWDINGLYIYLDTVGILLSLGFSRAEKRGRDEETAEIRGSSMYVKSMFANTPLQYRKDPTLQLNF
jgi:hypothetical protein